jgi:hypothetical protein
MRVFLSDTHFGVGKVNGKWHPYEDFRWADEFKLFLNEMNRQGEGRCDLIFNGDMFELWQSLKNDCVVKGRPDLGCTGKGALERIQRLLDQHSTELEAIGEFGRYRDNRVVIVPGNHDAVLLFPEVANAVLDKIKAPGRASVLSEGYWISEDGLIYSEHGHQIAKEVNTFDKWPRPFILSGGIQYIQRVGGQQFVQQFYNDFEAKYPIIDNVASEGTGLKLGVKAEGWHATVGDIGKFFAFYATELSFRQGVQPILGEPGEPPRWDIASIRGRGDRFLVESIPKDDELHAVAEKQLAEGKLAGSLASLTDDDIVDICNSRKARIAEDYDRGLEPALQPCPGDQGALQSLFNSRDKIFRGHFERTVKLLESKNAIKRRFAVFVWSHTHLADPGFHPRSKEQDGWNPLVVNTGAWQRTISEVDLAQLQKRRGLTDKQVLQLVPEDLPPCYPFVVVAAYQSEPSALLRFWHRTSAAGWGEGSGCGDNQ